MRELDRKDKDTFRAELVIRGELHSLLSIKEGIEKLIEFISSHLNGETEREFADSYVAQAFIDVEKLIYIYGEENCFKEIEKRKMKLAAWVECYDQIAREEVGE